MSLCGVEADVTRDELVALLALAKNISNGTAGRAEMPALVARAPELFPAWAPDVLCLWCPRAGPKHTCGCPHRLARRRLESFGVVWPETPRA